MKTLANYHANNSTYLLNGVSASYPAIGFPNGDLSYRSNSGKNVTDCFSQLPGLNFNKLFTAETTAEIAEGGIPNLEAVCRDLIHTFLVKNAPYSAMQFIPVLKEFTSIDRSETERFLKNPKTNHVLVKNDLIKVVLIHWKPGKMSNIHGHAKGGCVFKVLKGRLQENRYSPDAEKRLLAVSTFQEQSMAYIDDHMAYHAVGNPYGASAISLHVYTPGR